MRALVVDDSRAMRSLLRKYLGTHGIEVVAEAGNGQEALDKLGSLGPLEIALVDWNMPVMNGFDLLCTLRGDPKWSGMRVLMVTTETEANQILKALDAGADEYLIKPFCEASLRDKLSLMGVLD